MMIPIIVVSFMIIFAFLQVGDKTRQPESYAAVSFADDAEDGGVDDEYVGDDEVDIFMMMLMQL